MQNKVQVVDVNQLPPVGEVLAQLHPSIISWVNNHLGSLNEVQRLAIPRIMNRDHSLIMAPTGAGKTLAAFLGIISKLISMEEDGKLENDIYALYISPLKALNNDIHRNLEVPLDSIRASHSTSIKVAKRTGDTTTSERSKMLHNPPHILITTPESLALMLTAPKFKENLRKIQWVIVDEIHAIAGNKRGTLLSISLERMQYFITTMCTRIGLSATVEPPELVAKFLMGNRHCKIGMVNLGTMRDLDIQVISPTPNLIHAPMTQILKRHREIIKEQIDLHSTTLIFANTRHWSERLSMMITGKYPDFEDKIAVHHGSLAKEVRLSVEERLKQGELRAVFTSTSLELGIDIGSIDKTIQLGSPKTVRSFTQRIGRSGHSQDLQSKGSILVYDRDDLVESLAIAKLTKEGRIDEIRIPEAPVDVLFQMIVALAVEQRWTLEDAYSIISRAYPYRNINIDKFRNILLAQTTTTDDDNSWKHTLIWYDDEIREFGKRKRARQAFMQNVGTIPDVAMIDVVLETYRTRIGQVADRFAENLKGQDIFVLGGRSYQFIRSVGSKIIVKESVGSVPTVPNWAGEPKTRTFEISEEVSRLYCGVDARIDGGDQGGCMRWIIDNYHCSEVEAKSVMNYIIEQKSVGLVPHRRLIVVEEYIDPTGAKSILILSIFGRETNLVISKMIATKLSKQLNTNITTIATDNGFLLRLPLGIEFDYRTIFDDLVIDQLIQLLRDDIQHSEIFRNRFRQVAGRALLVLKRFGARKNSVNSQIKLSRWLLKNLPENFPIIEETIREILYDTYNINTARLVLGEIISGEIKIEYVASGSIPSPMTHSVLLNDNTEIILMSDKKSLLLNLHQQVLSRMLPQLQGNSVIFDHEQVISIFNQRIQVSHTKDREISVSRFFEIPVFHDDEISRCSELTGVESEIIEKFIVDNPDIYRWQGGYKSRKIIPYMAALHSESIWADYDNTYNSMRERSRELSPTTALEHLILQTLMYCGPLSAVKLAEMLLSKKENLDPILKMMVRKHSLLIGSFTSDEMQYIRYEDREVLIRKDGAMIDLDTLTRYRMWKMRLHRSSQDNISISSYLENNGPARDTIELVARILNFSWLQLRDDLGNRAIYFGRFLGRRLVFVSKSSVNNFILLSRNQSFKLNDLTKELLLLISEIPGMTLRDIMKHFTYSRQEIQASLNILEHELYISRVGWNLSLIHGGFPNPQYIPLPHVSYTDAAYNEAVGWLIDSCIEWYGPMSLQDLLRITRLPYPILEQVLDELKLDQIEIFSYNYYAHANQLDEIKEHRVENNDVFLLSPLDPYFYMVTGSLRWDSLPRQSKLMYIRDGKTLARVEVALPDTDILQVLNIQIAKKYMHDDDLLRKLAKLLVRVALRAFQARAVVIEDVNFKAPVMIDNRLLVQSFMSEDYFIINDILVGGVKNYSEYSNQDILETRLVNMQLVANQRYDNIDQMIENLDVVSVIDAPNMLDVDEKSAKLMLTSALRRGKLHHRSGKIYNPYFWDVKTIEDKELEKIFSNKATLTISEITTLFDSNRERANNLVLRGIADQLIESISPYSPVTEYRLAATTKSSRSERLCAIILRTTAKYGPLSFSQLQERIIENISSSRIEILLMIIDMIDDARLFSQLFNLRGRRSMLYFNRQQKDILDDVVRRHQLPQWMIFTSKTAIIEDLSSDCTHVVAFEGSPIGELVVSFDGDVVNIDELKFIGLADSIRSNLVELVAEIENYFFSQGYQYLSFHRIQSAYPEFWLKTSIIQEDV